MFTSSTRDTTKFELFLVEYISNVPRSGFHTVAPLGTASQRLQTKNCDLRGVLCESVLSEIVLCESVSFENVLSENLAEGQFNPKM